MQESQVQLWWYQPSEVEGFFLLKAIPKSHQTKTCAVTSRLSASGRYKG
jgi:hypothetical protein